MRRDGASLRAALRTPPNSHAGRPSAPPSPPGHPTGTTDTCIPPTREDSDVPHRQPAGGHPRTRRRSTASSWTTSDTDSAPSRPGCSRALRRGAARGARRRRRAARDPARSPPAPPLLSKRTSARGCTGSSMCSIRGCERLRSGRFARVPFRAAPRGRRERGLFARRAPAPSTRSRQPPCDPFRARRPGPGAAAMTRRRPRVRVVCIRSKRVRPSGARSSCRRSERRTTTRAATWASRSGRSRARGHSPLPRAGPSRSAYAAAAQAHKPSVAPLPTIESARSLGTSRVWPLRQTTV
jgi:hypothetical protein